MYPGSRKLEEIEKFDFFFKFHVPGVMKIRDNEFDLFEVSNTWGHKSWRKLKHLNFVKFRIPGFMKVGEN